MGLRRVSGFGFWARLKTPSEGFLGQSGFGRFFMALKICRAVYARRGGGAVSGLQRNRRLPAKDCRKIVEGEILRGIFPIPLCFSKAVLCNMAGMEPQYFFKTWNKDCRKTEREKWGGIFPIPPDFPRPHLAISTFASAGGKTRKNFANFGRRQKGGKTIGKQWENNGKTAGAALVCGRSALSARGRLQSLREYF